MGKFYLTTTLPYVNADPHIGFALEIVQADVIARYHKLIGDEVVFNTGTDEHGQKIYKKAVEEKTEPQVYADKHAKKFEELKKSLNLSFTNFIRTTDPDHKKAAQEFWKRCEKNGDIYKATYKIKYCVGCELEKTESELENGKCPIHPNLEVELIEEENYFFKFSKYQKALLEFYEKNPQFVIPDFRFNEIKEFVKKGLTDFSISRLKEKMPWGVPVPNDDKHVMYVWFDALVNYISTLGWLHFAKASRGMPQNEKEFKQYWPGIQFAGKDNLRQQSAMWQAMLMSAGLPNSRQIIIHGFITSDGQKISKSLGNVIDPFELVKKYGTDVVRYYLLREIPPFDDGDFSERRLKEIYNSDLANGLGNLVSRIAKLAEKNNIEVSSASDQSLDSEVLKHLEQYEFNLAFAFIWNEIKELDKKINDEKPWELSEEKAKPVLEDLIKRIQSIAYNLKPFLPETSEKIQTQFSGPKISSSEPLFPRI